jgi:hypothetical protein
MSRAHDKDVPQVEPPTAPASEPPGKVVVDARGRNVWQWAKDVLESTSVMLKRLENKDLALEPTRKLPIVSEKGAAPKGAKAGDSKTKAAKETDSKSRHPALQRERSREGGGGFDPYNSR